MKKRYVFRLWLIIIASFAALNTIVYQYVKAFYNERGNDYFLSANEYTASDLQSRIIAHYDLIEMPPVAGIVPYMDTLNAQYGASFDEIYYFVTNTPTTTSNGRFINPLLVNEFKQPGISIEKENIIYTNATQDVGNIYFKKQSSIFTFVFTKSLQSLLIDSTAIVFKEDGHLIYPIDTYGSQFYTLLEDSNSEGYATDFKTRLENEGSFISTGKISGSGMVIAASEVSQSAFTDRFYLTHFTTQYAFGQKYLPLLYMTVAELVVYSLLVLFIILYVMYNLSRSNNDYMGDMKAVRDENIYYLFFNKKGKLKNYNHTFKARVKGAKAFKKIEDFKTEDDLPLSVGKLEKENHISLKITTASNKVIILRSTILKRRDSFVILGEDMTKQLSDMGRIEKLAFHHPITRLPNIHKLEDDITLSNQGQYPFTLIAFDIQNFRHVNQMFGRNNGDEILQEVAIRLNQIFPRLYHIEGDLFIGYLETIVNREEIPRILKEISEQFARPLVLGPTKFEIDFRLGVFIKEDEIGFKEAYDKLMQALKTAKENTDRKYVIYDLNIGHRVTRDVVLQHQLRNALANDEFRVYFQPQVDLTTNKIVALESLIRWNNAHYEGESPQLLIQLAEKNNMIIPIGHFVLQEALKVAKILEPYEIKVSVNVSPLQIFQTGYVQEITAMLEKFNLAKNTIALELTETAIMESYGEVVNKLTALRENGFSIHLDDFGEGYSSFAYLKTLPADALKISYNFTKNIVVDKASANIVKEMISLAKNFDKLIICEGIETEAHAKMVARFGCNIGQGYWISRPVPFEEIKVLLKKHNNIDI